MKFYYTVSEIMELLQLGSKRTAYERVKQLNDELKRSGYWIERGKIPKSFFHEKYPYIKEEIAI